MSNVGEIATDALHWTVWLGKTPFLENLFFWNPDPCQVILALLEFLFDKVCLNKGEDASFKWIWKPTSTLNDQSEIPQTSNDQTYQ